MRATFLMRPLHVACVLAATVGAASAQPSRATSIGNDHRLFQRFIEDGAVAENVWLEGQFRFQSFDDADVFSIQPIVAATFAEDFEIGGRFGIATVDPERGDSESGFMDLDLFGKIRLTTKPTQFSAGLLLDLPTGDEDKSIRLGTGEMDVAFFGGIRHDFGSMSLVGNAGLRINQDPDVTDPDVLNAGGLSRSMEPEGETSISLGGGLLFAMTERLAGILELSYETERIDGLGSDLRVTLGGDYRLQESFGIRVAGAAGQDDGAPDFELIFSAVLLL